MWRAGLENFDWDKENKRLITDLFRVKTIGINPKISGTWSPDLQVESHVTKKAYKFCYIEYNNLGWVFGPEDSMCPVEKVIIRDL